MKKQMTKTELLAERDDIMKVLADENLNSKRITRSVQRALRCSALLDGWPQRTKI